MNVEIFRQDDFVFINDQDTEFIAFSCLTNICFSILKHPSETLCKLVSGSAKFVVRTYRLCLFFLPYLYHTQSRRIDLSNRNRIN